ncbi:rCG32177 [Rattus norvegicus]|uniref:RCG32177 n=1 Tax=Rattus norvegicus TaxID=10116 RepID=A6JWY3_RAT|nr:rCG32177 [Rattus norvegicus]
MDGFLGEGGHPGKQSEGNQCRRLASVGTPAGWASASTVLSVMNYKMDRNQEQGKRNKVPLRKPWVNIQTCPSLRTTAHTTSPANGT